jgi:hypothetical protein
VSLSLPEEIEDLGGKRDERVAVEHMIGDGRVGQQDAARQFHRVSDGIPMNGP